MTELVCRLCDRLVQHREAVANKTVMLRKAYAGHTYWGRPVADFAPEDPNSVRLLIVGLAPGAHGANRTGRMFTGDDSGRWLYPALHRYGFAQTAGFSEANDNQLVETAITCVVRCVPPDNKPNSDEILNCASHLKASFARYQPEFVLCLGALAWKEAHRAQGLKAPPFQHGLETQHSSQLGQTPTTTWFASYHPSRQNTNTGVLTESMWNAIFERIRAHIDTSA